MAPLAINESIAEDEEQVAEAIDDVITHFIQVGKLGENEQDDATADGYDHNQFTFGYYERHR